MSIRQTSQLSITTWPTFAKEVYCSRSHQFCNLYWTVVCQAVVILLVVFIVFWNWKWNKHLHEVVFQHFLYILKFVPFSLVDRVLKSWDVAFTCTFNCDSWGPPRVNSDKWHGPKTAHKMKSWQDTTSLGQIATVTAKLTISDKHL